VLFPLGLWLLLGAQRLPPGERELSGRARVAIWGLSLVVGLGGIYGIGGGSILAPILLACGYSAYQVAPATLAATFFTSLVGVGAYQVLQLTHGGSIAPDWILGLWVGAGGFIGSYLGARLQSRLPERSLRRLLGLIRKPSPRNSPARRTTSARPTAFTPSQPTITRTGVRKLPLITPTPPMSTIEPPWANSCQSRGRLSEGY
jgi:Sulfite exporter TauE/SafE